MITTTFRDFAFRAMHHLPERHGVASMPHWHSYVVRLWFSGSPDQDTLLPKIEKTFAALQGGNLNTHIEDSTDEGVALWFYFRAQDIGQCVRVRVTNDGQRGAETLF